MVDPIFVEPRLAQIYDPLDPDRSDLDAYAAIAHEFSAHRVLDIGCGTGTFACLLAGQDLEVTALDPAAASLEVARTKPGAERVYWLHGYPADLPPLQVDLVTMTANVAQVFLTDEAWATALLRARAALRPGGQLVFETRNPAAKAWLDWNRARSYKRTFIPDVGEVETWVELIYVSVGVDHDTAAFAVNAIRAWWYNVGAKRYPGSTRLLVTADAGGSNGYRLRTWKVELATLAAEIGRDISVVHYPSGASKWNKIEHRLFSFISINWRGRPLTDYQVIVETIAATTTDTGLRVEAVLDEGTYPTGVKVTNAAMKAVPLTPHQFHGEWNYTIHKASSPEPAPVKRTRKKTRN